MSERPWRTGKTDAATIRKIIEIAMSPTTKTEKIFAAVQLTVIGIGFWALRNAQAYELEMAKKKYEEDRARGNQSSVDTRL